MVTNLLLLRHSRRIFDTLLSCQATADTVGKSELNLHCLCEKLGSLMAEQSATLLRELPSIDRLLKHGRCVPLFERYNREYVTQKCRQVLGELRNQIRQA